MTKSSLTFEQAITQLETIVLDMENNTIALDSAMDKYQEGMNLVKFCQEKLTDATQKIKILDPENNTLKDFAVNES